MSRVHEVELCERAERPGGHTNTVAHEGLALDTGFVVHNMENYPCLTRLSRQTRSNGEAEISFPLPMALTMKTLGAMPGALSRRGAARLSKRPPAR